MPGVAVNVPPTAGVPAPPATPAAAARDQHATGAGRGVEASRRSEHQADQGASVQLFRRAPGGPASTSSEWSGRGRRSRTGRCCCSPASRAPPLDVLGIGGPQGPSQRRERGCLPATPPRRRGWWRSPSHPGCVRAGGTLAAGPVPGRHGAGVGQREELAVRGRDRSRMQPRRNVRSQATDQEPSCFSAAPADSVRANCLTPLNPAGTSRATGQIASSPTSAPCRHQSPHPRSRLGWRSGRP